MAYNPVISIDSLYSQTTNTLYQQTTTSYPQPKYGIQPYVISTDSLSSQTIIIKELI
jgi:hypothetical protein